MAKIQTAPSKIGKVLSKGDNKVTLSKEEHNNYRSGVGNILHMMHCSRPGILNPVCECLMTMSCTME